MANQNPEGSAKYWFDGESASAIDNGAPKLSPLEEATNNWLGNSNYWFRGSPQGFLQGGPGTIAESPENITMFETDEPPQPPAVKKQRSYAIIL
jgi:hypothetical protein